MLVLSFFFCLMNCTYTASPNVFVVYHLSCLHVLNRIVLPIEKKDGYQWLDIFRYPVISSSALYTHSVMFAMISRKSGYRLKPAKRRKSPPFSSVGELPLEGSSDGDVQFSGISKGLSVFPQFVSGVGDVGMLEVVNIICVGDIIS